jgi:hypothetical protein
VWIAVAVLAAIVVGVVVWWLRRDAVGGDTGDAFEAERKWDWELRLTPEAETAFMEGLRAYHDAGNALDLAAEQGVLTAYAPPRLISLSLLADAFAELGDAAMHDPHDTVAAMMAGFASAERPGVLHLREEWMAGEVDGMDGAAFADAVREIVRGEGIRAWPGGDGIGALQLRVLADEAAPAEAAPAEETPSGPAVTEETPSGPAPIEETPSHLSGGPVAGGPATATIEQHVAVPEHESRQANTMLLDLARVLDLYLETREKRPDAAAGELLREVVAGVIAAGGPGLTWVRPPTPEERGLVVAGCAEPR